MVSNSFLDQKYKCSQSFNIAKMLQETMLWSVYAKVHGMGLSFPLNNGFLCFEP